MKKITSWLMDSFLLLSNSVNVMILFATWSILGCMTYIERYWMAQAYIKSLFFTRSILGCMTYICMLNGIWWRGSSMILYIKYLFIGHQINSWLYDLHMYIEWFWMAWVVHDFVYKISIYLPPDQFLVVWPTFVCWMVFDGVGRPWFCI